MKLHSNLQLLFILWNVIELGQSLTKKIKLSMVYHRKYPNVAYNRHPIQGFCSRGPEKGLVLRLMIYKGSNLLASLDLENIQKGKTNGLLNISVKDVSASKKPGKAKRVAFKICTTQLLDRAWIYCEREASRGYVAGYNKRSLVHFRHPPTRPKFFLERHLKPNILLAGRVVTLKCGAVVEIGGHLGYKLTTPQVTQYWNITWDSPFPSTQMGRLQAKVTFSQSFQPKYGPYIDSTFRLNVTSQMEGGVFTCFASDFPPNVVNKNPLLRREVELLPVTVQADLRGLPQFFLHRPFKYYGLWNVIGYCRVLAFWNETTIIRLGLRTDSNSYIHFGEISPTKMHVTKKMFIGERRNTVRLFVVVADANVDRGYKGLMLKELIFETHMDMSAANITYTCNVNSLVRCEPAKSPGVTNSMRSLRSPRQTRGELIASFSRQAINIGILLILSSVSLSLSGLVGSLLLILGACKLHGHYKENQT